MLDDVSWQLEGIDYLGICSYQGQDYEIAAGAERFLCEPYPGAIVRGIHDNDLEKPDGTFSFLTKDCMMLILKMLELDDLVVLGSCSKNLYQV